MAGLLCGVRLGPRHVFRGPGQAARPQLIYRQFARCSSSGPRTAPAEEVGNAKGKRLGRESQGITPMSEDFSKWYLDVVREAQLADYGPVRGTMVIRPYGYAIWEGLQTWLNTAFAARGVQNCYFPQLIPISFLEKEAEHVQGFAPELAIVTKGGGKDLEEPLALRPTSETIINSMLGRWIHSHRDLPLRLNQWANVHRWEMRTRPFVRTLEFLWQEGHTAHAGAAEARAEAMDMLAVYEAAARTQAAMPVIPGRKSRVERFAGADATFTIEAMMRDGRALQAGTTHDLGDNFARAFGTTYDGADGVARAPHQCSFGMSTRMVGGLLMSHGDDLGLRLPPALAPIQAVVVPIPKKGADGAAVLVAARNAVAALAAAGVRVKLDDAADRSPGWKYSHWEMRGVPLRIEIGPRDVAAGTCVVARRDVPGNAGKQGGVPLAAEGLVPAVKDLLQSVQESLLRRATEFRDANIVDVTDHAGFRDAIAQGKWARGYWAGSDDQEKAMKEETGATLRCFPLEQPKQGGICFLTGQQAQEVALFAKAY